MSIEENKPLDWDDEIEKENEFVELPGGDYDFVIDHYERARFNGSEKIPPCNEAIVYFNIVVPGGQSVQVRESYKLCQSMEWKLSNLFRGVGLKKEGERLSMPWSKLAGSSGRCAITLDPDKNDPSKKYNHIKKLYPKEAKSWQGGFK